MTTGRAGRVRRTAIALAVAAWAGFLGGCGGDAHPHDTFDWLDSVHGARATAWVTARNARTHATLSADPRYRDNLAQARAIGRTSNRIPTPTIIDGEVYNFWQDAGHVRGIWRKTTPADYDTPRPRWTTVLDVDALAATEHHNWVWKGATCDPVTETHCLIGLSDGGEDAQTLREFDLTTNRFPPGGFVLPRGKQNASWLDADTLLVAREWRPGEVTSSGYPYIVKQWRRGQPLGSAVEVGRGEKTDVTVDPDVLTDSDGHRVALISRSSSFFEHNYRLITGSGTVALALPPKSTPVALVDNRILVSLDQNWSPTEAPGSQSAALPSGSLVSIAADAAERNPQHLRAVPVFTPGPLDTVQGVAATHDQVIITSLQNVRGRVTLGTPQPDGSWSTSPIPLPDNATITTAATDSRSSLAYLTVSSFLTPPTLLRLDTGNSRVGPVKTMPAQFDPRPYTVDQQQAVSPDGTRVPYFIVHRTDEKLDGTNPTILYAYGGFGDSITPSYSGTLGKLWLDHGGVYVVANIRGGGEFGPAWHDAALITHRQRAFDDFAAVGRDLIARKVTSPQHLGIQGGSNGGLLMGVEFTQHPELWHAVDMQVPLLDMMRYEHIEAGASWVGEYGSVENPTQRAFLHSISPYQQLKRAMPYPEPLIWTSTTDDRVGPQHARQFAAELGSMGYPYLFYEITDGGHGSGANIDERAMIAALEYTYFMRKLMD